MYCTFQWYIFCDLTPLSLYYNSFGILTSSLLQVQRLSTSPTSLVQCLIDLRETLVAERAGYISSGPVTGNLTRLPGCIAGVLQV